MNAAVTLVRLRWALTWATLRKSAWQTVAYVLAAILAIGAIAGTIAATWAVGSLPPFVQADDGSAPIIILGQSGIVRITTVLAGAFATLVIGLFQLTILGEGSTMSPRKFALYGIPDRQLQFGLLLSGLSGLPAITGTIMLVVWSFTYRSMGVITVVASIIAAPLAILTMMSLSKLLIALSTTLITSKRGKSLFYIIVVLLFVFVWQIPNLLMNSGAASQIDLDTANRAADIMAWTPFGAAFQLPYDVFAGNWLASIARLVILAVTWVACFSICTWCLRHERLTLGAGHEATVSVKGIGVFSHMPDSPSGAISARLFTYLVRDPRQAMLFVMPVFCLIILALQMRTAPGIIWLVPLMSGWLMPIAESNGLSYDGRGFMMQVIAGVSGTTDRLGRVRIYVGIIVAYLLVLFVAIAFISGDWRSGEGLLIGATFTAVGLGVGLCGLGLAEVTSCAFMYPVASLDKPFSAPQGRMVAQGFFPLIYMFGSLLLMFPTGIVAIILMVMSELAYSYWLIIPIVIVNGAGVLAAGTWLGGKLMDARMLSIVRTLDSFASLQK